MNRPYEIRFTKRQRESRRTLAPWSRYALVNARERKHLVFEGSEMCLQVLKREPFYLELFELETTDCFELRYEIFEEQHFLFFMLEGSVQFRDERGYYVSSAKQNHMAFVSNRPGVYCCNLSKGRYTALCIAFERWWLDFFASGQELLTQYFGSYPKVEYPMLPYAALSAKQIRFLRAMHSELQRSPAPLDGQLRYYIAMVFEEYVALAQKKGKNPVWKMKSYLDQEYRSAEMSLNAKAKSLGIPLERLRNQFKSEIGISPHQYYTERRISKVQEILSKQQLPLSKIFELVGYRDESALRYAMKRFGLLR